MFRLLIRDDDIDQRDKKEDAADDGSSDAEATPDAPGERNANKCAENSELIVHIYLQRVDF